MSALSRRSVVFAVATALVASGVLSDVSAQRSAPPAAEKRAGRNGDPADDAKMTREQKIGWVEEQVASAQQVYRRVESMLEQAKKEKDSIKITCLQDKLTQLEVNLQGVEERRMLFEESLSNGDAIGSEQQFTILRIYVARVQSLMAEAENCVGEGDVVIGESDTILTIDQDVTGEDPTEPIDWQVGVDQPVHASAFF
jgi:hypothetical protein